MKKVKIIMVIIAVMFVYSLDAAKIAILPGHYSKFPKYVAIFWKGGTSGYRPLGEQDQIILSSPWNKDINLIRWSEYTSAGKTNYYNFPVHIPTIRAPWLKDPWLIISDNGLIRFNDGQSQQERYISPAKTAEEIQKKLGEEWVVID